MAEKKKASKPASADTAAPAPQASAKPAKSAAKKPAGKSAKASNAVAASMPLIDTSMAAEAAAQHGCS